MYGDSHCDCEVQRLNAIKTIALNDGIFIHLPQEAQGWGLFYKLKELELQVSGRSQDGEFLGVKNRDEAQELLLNSNSFFDNRSYAIIAEILKILNLNNNQFVLLSDSDRKIEALKKSGLDIIKYSEFTTNEVNEDNLSEYLIKILNLTHKFDDKIFNDILNLINQKKYNGRSLATLVEIVNKIKNDKNYKLNDFYKKQILETYENIICGVEKNYIFVDENKIKTQNKFSCKVNFTIFKILFNVYKKNIFDRISFEKMYYFNNKNDNEKIIIRTSRVLDTFGEDALFFKGQFYAQEKIINNDGRKIIENEITISRLRSFFENPNYDYEKRVEMITFISEDQVPGINIYIKRLPNIENRIMDIYGSKKEIRSFINKIVTEHDKKILHNLISDKKYENEDFTDYNLRFADMENAINQEIEIYNLLKEECKKWNMK